MNLKRLRIFVDAQPLLREKSGVGYYLANLLNLIARIDNLNHFHLVAFSFSLKTFQFHFGLNFTQTIIRIIPRKVYLMLLENHLLLPIELFSGFHDVYFFDNFISFPVFHGGIITVIHDLTFIKYPEFVEEKNLKHLQKLVPPSIKRSNILIAVSETIKRELLETFSLADSRVIVIQPCVNFIRPEIHPKDELVFLKKHKFQKFILFLGNMEPRKNLHRLIKAYKLLASEIQKEYPLVIAGGVGWRNDAIMSEMPGRKNIIYVGYVTGIEKEILYQHATLFVFPSIYEGFGMPLIEAMDHNIPVVTSKISCLPEVAGDAGIYIDPYDEEDIADGILRGLQNETLRLNHIEEGKKRVIYYKNIHQENILLEAIKNL